MGIDSWLKKKGKAYKKKKKINAKIKAKAEEAYYEAKEKEQIKLAKQKAKQERVNALEDMKNKGKGTGKYSKIANIAEGLSGMSGALMGEMPKDFHKKASSSNKKKKRKKQKSKKKNSKGNRNITISLG